MERHGNNVYKRHTNTNNLGLRKDIVKHEILLDKFTRMNTSYTKQVFSEKKKWSNLISSNNITSEIDDNQCLQESMV